MRNFFLINCLIFIFSNFCLSQELRFNHILSDNSDYFLSAAQDKYGVMWFTRYLKGLQRFDGTEFKTYLHDPYNDNSVASNYIEVLAIDEHNIFLARYLWTRA